MKRGRMKTGLCPRAGVTKATKSIQTRTKNRIAKAVTLSGSRSGGLYISEMIEKELQSGPVKKYTKEEIAKINEEMRGEK